MAASSWGILGIAIVVFDIDEGQKVESFYPEGAIPSKECSKLVAYLSLPHTNATTSKIEQGDVQYCFRYRQNAKPDLFDAYV